MTFKRHYDSFIGVPFKSFILKLKAPKPAYTSFFGLFAYFEFRGVLSAGVER